MNVDDRALGELIVESQDMQSDAMRSAKAVLPDMADLREDRRGDEVDPEQVDLFNSARRALVRRLGLGAGGVAGLGIFGALSSLLATPASAQSQSNLDVQILQTASSLETLAVATYGAALQLPFIANGNKTVVTFAQMTMSQHDQHNKAFQSQTTALGGTPQTTPNPKYAPIVESTKPNLKGPADVVKLAATLETVATETYLADLSMFSDSKSKGLMGSVMGVEAQHLATLRAVEALLASPDLIAIPVDASKLPAAAGSVAFPQPFEPTTMASPPAEGAVK